MTPDDIDAMQQWLADFESKATQAGDERRQKLVAAFRALAGSLEDESARKRMEKFGENVLLARELDESCLELLFLHGKMLARLELDEYQGAIEEATRGVMLLSRTPEYRLSACTLHDLVAVYQAVDARGFSDSIQSSLEKIQLALQPDDLCSGCVRSCRVQQQLACEAFDDAQTELMHALERLAEEPSGSAEPRDREQRRREERSRKRSRGAYYLNLCSIAYSRRDWEQLQRWCAAANACLDCMRPTMSAELRLWQALLARHAGREEEATRLERSVRRSRQRTSLLPSPQFWDAWSGFYEASGDLIRALRVRRQQLRAISNRGMLGAECQCWIAIAHLKQRLGRLYRDECLQARRVAERLPRPEIYVDQLPTPGA